jgi:MFS family permease
MIFGAFANFALNEWGDTLIVLCEGIMVISFMFEIIKTLFLRIKNKFRKKTSIVMFSAFILLPILILCVFLFAFLFGKALYILLFIIIGLFLFITAFVIIEALVDFFKKVENQFIYENYFLALFFLALFFRNSAAPGAGPMLVGSIVFLVPYFSTTTIKFFKGNYKDGKQLTLVLTIGSLATILLGFVFMFKTMHWPYATMIFNISIVFIAVMIAGVIKWKYVYQEKKVNILQGLRLFKTNIIFIFFMLFIFISYRLFTTIGIAPGFYSSEYPENFYKYNNSTNEWEKAEEIRNVYDEFIHKAGENEFIK